MTSRGSWCIAFTSPTPEGAEYVGRNHRFVAALARWLMESALEGRGEGVVARCGAIRTRSVQRLTVLLLLRVRYLVRIPPGTELLSEEVLVTGYEGLSPDGRWLEREEAMALLLAQPDANMSLAEKQELVGQALESTLKRALPTGEEVRSAGFSLPERTEVRTPNGMEEMILQRARELEESHKRIRQAVSLRVRELQVQPQLPPDLLGILVLQPVVEG